MIISLCSVSAERTHEWPTGSLEDLVSNLVKNWEKEASYKTRLEDWRTINTKTYKFSCNGGRKYTADEMMEIGTYNALIQVSFRTLHHSFSSPVYINVDEAQVSHTCLFACIQAMP